jgi:hypothetical protein
VTRKSLPPGLRALDALAAHAHRMARAAAGVRDETVIAWTAPADRADLTRTLFDGAPTYAPGGAMFALGLLDWERELLAPPFPERGRVLIGGAGGGREAIALLARGYAVYAFDPAGALVRAGAPAVEASGGALVHASYADVVRAAEGRPSRLDAAFAEPVDAVLLGWGSLSLLVSDDERRALFRALRVLAPRAPVALSFDEIVEPESDASGVARLRGALRRVYRARGAPGYTGERMRYAPWAGIIRESSLTEVETVARDAGYHAAKHGSEPGRMLLMPAGSPPERP